MGEREGKKQASNGLESGGRRRKRTFEEQEQITKTGIKRERW